MNEIIVALITGGITLAGRFRTQAALVSIKHSRTLMFGKPKVVGMDDSEVGIYGR